MYRKITDYFSMFLLMPILIVVSGNWHFLFNDIILKQMDAFAPACSYYEIHDTAYPFRPDMADVHRGFSSAHLHAEYKSKIQTRAHCRHSGGVPYQAFQFLYMNSQLWVSKYNAILR